MSNQLAISTNPDWSSQQVALIQQQICPGLSLQHLELLGQVVRKTGLDPFTRQIYAIARKTKDGVKMTIQVSIDGFRLLADRSKKYGGSETFWCDEEGSWKDVWLAKNPPAAAKTVVYRLGCEKPFVGIALWDEYKQEVPLWKNGQVAGHKLGDMWAKMPATMLAKCSESIALRKAFPAELSGLYTSEEMMQADAPETAVVVHATPQDSRPKLPASAVVSESGKMPAFLAEPEPGPTQEEQDIQDRVNAQPARAAKRTQSPEAAKAKPPIPNPVQKEFADKLTKCGISDEDASAALTRLMKIEVADWRTMKDKQLAYTMGEGWDKFSQAIADIAAEQEVQA